MIFQEALKRRSIKVLEILSRIISASIQSTTVFIFMMLLLRYTGKKFILKNIICFIGLTVLILTVHSTEYSTMNPIIIFIAIVYALSLIYKINFSRAFLCSGIFMLALFLSDIMVTLLYVPFINAVELRSDAIYLICANLLNGLIVTTIISIKKIRNYFAEIIAIYEKRKGIETTAFVILIICALSTIFYMISQNYLLNKAFLLNIVGLLIFLLLALIFFKEKYEKEKMINKYDQLFEYVKTFEEWMDTENMNIHESKNQLITLRDMLKNNKKAKEYIDNIIKERIEFNDKSIEKLKHIPKGGLKGLIYYKIITAENHNIEMFLDISHNSKQDLERLTLEQNKDLCRLMGIFFDNAIEATKNASKKLISFEIYSNESGINIIISNTYDGSLEIEKLWEKGYSTKGMNRGKGLYLARKTSERNKKIILESRIINNYYVQKIVIKTKDK